jgi:hypothetical protein
VRANAILTCHMDDETDFAIQKGCLQQVMAPTGPDRFTREFQSVLAA